MVEYDVLGNERHKAICKLREMPKLYPGKDGSADVFAWKYELANAIGANTELFSAIRDRLIHLLGGDQPTLSDMLKGDDDGVDARPSDSASADSLVHDSAGCACGVACGCDGEEPLAPITTELREYMESYRPFEDAGHVVVSRIGTIGFEGFDRLCDNIDAIHAGLERDYATACRVNEHQDLEYVALAKRYDNTISLPMDADGVPIRIGDVMEWPDGDDEPFEVVGIGDNGTLFYMYDGSCEWTNAKNKVHHVPTVEDVLREFSEKMNENLGMYTGEVIDAGEWRKADERTIAEYAAKLKLADA